MGQQPNFQPQQNGFPQRQPAGGFQPVQPFAPDGVPGQGKYGLDPQQQAIIRQALAQPNAGDGFNRMQPQQAPANGNRPQGLPPNVNGRTAPNGLSANTPRGTAPQGPQSAFPQRPQGAFPQAQQAATAPGQQAVNAVGQPLDKDGKPAENFLEELAPPPEQMLKGGLTGVAVGLGVTEITKNNRLVRGVDYLDKKAGFLKPVNDFIERKILGRLPKQADELLLRKAKSDGAQKASEVMQASHIDRIMRSFDKRQPGFSSQFTARTFDGLLTDARVFSIWDNPFDAPKMKTFGAFLAKHANHTTLDGLLEETNVFSPAKAAELKDFTDFASRNGQHTTVKSLLQSVQGQLQQASLSAEEKAKLTAYANYLQESKSLDKLLDSRPHLNTVQELTRQTQAGIRNAGLDKQQRKLYAAYRRYLSNLQELAHHEPRFRDAAEVARVYHQQVRNTALKGKEARVLQNFRQYLKSKNNYKGLFVSQAELAEELSKKNIGPIGRGIAQTFNYFSRILGGQAMFENMGVKLSNGANSGAKQRGANLLGPFMMGAMTWGQAWNKARKAEDGEKLKTFFHTFLGEGIGNFIGWEVGVKVLQSFDVMGRILGKAAAWQPLRRIPLLGRMTLGGALTQIIAMFVIAIPFQKGFEKLSDLIFGKLKDKQDKPKPPALPNGTLNRNNFSYFRNTAAGTPAKPAEGGKQSFSLKPEDIAQSQALSRQEQLSADALSMPWDDKNHLNPFPAH